MDFVLDYISVNTYWTILFIIHALLAVALIGALTHQASTRVFFRTLNSVGLTGVIDPGGYNFSVPDCQALFQVWRERALTLRACATACARRAAGTSLRTSRR
jgi:hypothetical protein